MLSSLLYEAETWISTAQADKLHAYDETAAANHDFSLFDKIKMKKSSGMLAYLL